MNKDKKKLLNLAEIEGRASPHSAQVKGALRMRAPALALVKNAGRLAEYCGGYVEKLELGEDWAVSKEIYPGAVIHLVFFSADSEYTARLQAFYSGDNIHGIRGEELAMLTISLANQSLRYLRVSSPSPELPQICYKV